MIRRTDMGNITRPAKVSAEQRIDLEALMAKRVARAGFVRRVRVILLSADGVSGAEIAQRVGVSQEMVSRIRGRWAREGIDGLYERPKAGRKDHVVPPDVVHQIVALATSPPPAGRSRWTARLLGKATGCSFTSAAKILRAHDLKPHRARTFKVSRDPKFAEKVEDVVGLYLNPPANAVVVSMDEKTQIQALQRTQLPLPLRKGRAVRHTHDYKRHGVVDLYAALEVATGKVTHACADRHTAVEFLAFMKQVARAYPGKELHVILDNSSSHGTADVVAWLAKHPRIHFHYTPTSASWLNQVEGLFGILTKQSLSLTDFTGKADLRRHIEAYLAGWNANPTPFVWTKPANGIIRSHKRMLDHISRTMH
jgi:transposase